MLPVLQGTVAREAVQNAATSEVRFASEAAPYVRIYSAPHTATPATNTTPRTSFRRPTPEHG